MHTLFGLFLIRAYATMQKILLCGKAQSVSKVFLKRL